MKSLFKKLGLAATVALSASIVFGSVLMANSGPRGLNHWEMGEDGEPEQTIIDLSEHLVYFDESLVIELEQGVTVTLESYAPLGNSLVLFAVVNDPHGAITNSENVFRMSLDASVGPVWSAETRNLGPIATGGWFDLIHEGEGYFVFSSLLGFDHAVSGLDFEFSLWGGIESNRFFLWDYELDLQSLELGNESLHFLYEGEGWLNVQFPSLDWDDWELHNEMHNEFLEHGGYILAPNQLNHGFAYLDPRVVGYISSVGIVDERLHIQVNNPNRGIHSWRESSVSVRLVRGDFDPDFFTDFDWELVEEVELVNINDLTPWDEVTATMQVSFGIEDGEFVIGRSIHDEETGVQLWEDLATYTEFIFDVDLDNLQEYTILLGISAADVINVAEFPSPRLVFSVYGGEDLFLSVEIPGSGFAGFVVPEITISPLTITIRGEAEQYIQSIDGFLNAGIPDLWSSVFGVDSRNPLVVNLADGTSVSALPSSGWSGFTPIVPPEYDWDYLDLDWEEIQENMEEWEDFLEHISEVHANAPHRHTTGFTARFEGFVDISEIVSIEIAGMVIYVN